MSLTPRLAKRGRFTKVSPQFKLICLVKIYHLDISGSRLSTKDMGRLTSNYPLVSFSCCTI